MPSDDNRRRVIEAKTQPASSSNLENILVVVKAPPHISQKYTETVCTAGVSDKNGWIRLYPLNFRDLPYARQYKKYQWIQVEVEKHQDQRPESYRPIISSLKLGEILDTKNKWQKRKEYLLPLAVRSLEEVYKNYRENYISLAIFKPKRILELTMAPAEQRTAAQQRKQDQLSLLNKSPRRLDHIEYRFKYVFECNDQSCKRHTLTIEDWEIQELYRYAKEKFGPYALDKILQYVKTKWLDEMWSDKKDSYLIVGSVAHTKAFVVLGVFWPPK